MPSVLKVCLGASHELNSRLGSPSWLKDGCISSAWCRKSATPSQPLLFSPAVPLAPSLRLNFALCCHVCSSTSRFLYQAKIFHFFMHSSHTVRLSLFFPQVPWCYLFLFLISYVLSHILPFCLPFLKLQLDSTFGTQRFICVNLKKCLEKHIKAKKQT